MTGSPVTPSDFRDILSSGRFYNQADRMVTTAATTPNVPFSFFTLQSGETCELRTYLPGTGDVTITNTGDETAHNVCITVTLHNSRNEVINLNGVPSLQRCIGELAGGQAKTESISVDADCGAFATRCIGQTLTLQTQVSSDEKTAQFPDQVIPV